MKVVATWPDYGRSQLLAVREDGAVFGLAMLPDAMATEWYPIANPIQPLRSDSHKLSDETDKCPGGHCWLPWSEPYRLMDVQKTMQTRHCANLSCRFREDREVTEQTPNRTPPASPTSET